MKSTLAPFSMHNRSRATKCRQNVQKQELERLGVYVPHLSRKLTLSQRQRILQAAKHDAICMQAYSGEYHALLF